MLDTLNKLILPPGAVRLILALTVVAHHVLPLVGYEIFTPLDGAAVYAFFFLSGYWIKKLWETKYSYCRNPILTFYISRASRILPGAAIATMAMLLITEQAHPWWITASNFLLLGANYAGLIVAPVWSLDIEMQFYLLTPAILPLLTHKRSKNLLLLITAGLLAIRTLFAVTAAAPFFVFLFILGALSAEENVKKDSRLPAFGILALVAIYAAANTHSVRDAILQHGVSGAQIVKTLHVLFTLCLIPYLRASLAIRSKSLDRHIGNLAFPVYVLHWPAIYLSLKVVPSHFIAGTAIITAVGSVLIYAFFERPLTAVRERFVEQRRQPVLPTGLQTSG